MEQTRDLSANSSLLDVFRHYANPSNPERLTLTGVIRFYDLLRIDVETDPIVLCISYLMNCTCMYVVTRKDIQTLMNALQVTSFYELDQAIAHLRVSFADPTFHKEVYVFTFMYTVRSQENAMRKRMCLSCAIALWKLFFQHLPDSFVSYLQRTRSEQEGIRQDEWNMFYSFMCLPPGSFDPNGPWPLLYCDYM
ncbi:hypothetical protein WA588_002590, partial [Blastocystis sp. NMH]